MNKKNVQTMYFIQMSIEMIPTSEVFATNLTVVKGAHIMSWMLVP